MISVIILNKGEDNVVKLTYENLWRELKDIPDTELLVSEDWMDYLPKIKNRYVCFVEPDCLVSSGYFTSLLGHIKKNSAELNKLGMFSATTAVNNWAVRFYGYDFGDEFTDQLVPNKAKKLIRKPFYAVQVAYAPGALLKLDFLKTILAESKLSTDNLVNMSAQLSTSFWKHNWQVFVVPGVTYVTTENYVNDICDYELQDKELINKFKRESI